MKVQNERESSSGQETPLGGPSKGSTEVLIGEISSTVEICSGLKLHFLKVTFIFHVMQCCMLRERFYFRFPEGFLWFEIIWSLNLQVFKEIKCIFSIFEPNVWPLGNAAKERITNTRKAL